MLERSIVGWWCESCELAQEQGGGQTKKRTTVAESDGGSRSIDRGMVGMGLLVSEL